MRRILGSIYERLYQNYGPQKWWPGDSVFEIIVGAILTQNTSWTNVEKAIVNLKKHNLLTPIALKKISRPRLAKLIRPAGFFNVKTKRLKSFIEYLFARYNGDLREMQKQPLDDLRKELLCVHGIGEETADSILLYAFSKPIFVVDAYTKRFFTRHKLIGPQARYEKVQEIFMENLQHDERVFNEYHALIVRLSKDFCKARARCEQCPLNFRKYYHGAHLL